MSELYNQLRDLGATRGYGRASRFRVAERLVDEMLQNTSMDANQAYRALCDRVLEEVTPQPSTPLRWGEFKPPEAIDLIGQGPRVSGYMHAISRAAEARRIIDVGGGPGLVLGLGAAVLHGEAQVDVYEINETSVESATYLTQLLGVDDRVTVHHADALSVSLGEADLGITETFAHGLLVEPGTRVLDTLAGTCQTVLPQRIRIFANDIEPDADYWQDAGLLRFTRDERSHDRIRGSSRVQQRERGMFTRTPPITMISICPLPMRSMNWI